MNAAPDPGVTILGIEDHEVVWRSVERACRGEGWTFEFHATGEAGLERFAAEPDRFAAALVDLQLPGMDGYEVLQHLRRRDPSFPVLHLTGEGDVDSVVRCMRAGAYDYLTKPFRPDDLVHRLRRAIESRSREKRLAYFEAGDFLSQVMGPSNTVAVLARRVSQVGPTDMTVLVQGESGTGKEVLARRIHALSRRAPGPFVAVDCGAIPESLIESELFGAMKGSFTGAIADRQGKFAAAAGGTLFLDEIGNLPLSMQARLLRALQEREVTPIGATRPTPLDIRVVAATNCRLEDLVEKNEFRLDLYHRLAEFPLEIPPLRERTDDLLHLATRFLQEASRELGVECQGFGETAIATLFSHSWPGNARELQSAIRRAALLGEGRIDELPVGRLAAPPPPKTGVQALRAGGDSIVRVEGVIPGASIDEGRFPLKPFVRNLVDGIERAVISTVLERVGGNKSQVSRVLEVDYKTVLTKIRELGLE